MNVWKEFSKQEIDSMHGADFDEDEIREGCFIEEFEEHDDNEQEGCKCRNGCSWCLMTDW